MDELIKILVQRLIETGIAVSRIPACITMMWDVTLDYPIEGYQELNRLMQALDWKEFELDEHTFNLFMLVINDRQSTQLPEHINFADASKLEGNFSAKTQ